MEIFSKFGMAMGLAIKYPIKEMYKSTCYTFSDSMLFANIIGRFAISLFYGLFERNNFLILGYTPFP